MNAEQIEYLRDLNQLALGVANVAKTAAYNIGSSTQVIPTHGYTNGSGIYDPDDSRAYTSQLALRRGEYAAAQVDQGRTKMIDLLPYRGQLNEGYGVIQQNMQKSASLDEVEYWTDEDYAEYEQAMLDSGLFDDVDAIPTPEVYMAMLENSMEKAASVTDEQISDMLEFDVFDNIECPEYIDELVESDEELDYYFEE